MSEEDEFLKQLDNRIQIAKNREEEVRLEIESLYKSMHMVQTRLNALKDVRIDYVTIKEEDKK